MRRAAVARSALRSPGRVPLRYWGDVFFEEMTERIGRVFPERSALRVPRMTVEGERRRLMDAGLEAHALETLARSLLRELTGRIRGLDQARAAEDAA